jgi:hypothetical protein
MAIQAPDIWLNVAVNKALFMALLNRKNHLEGASPVNTFQLSEE